MKLPNSENAYVASEKLHNYLLSTTHPVGRGKAKFFRGIGFNNTNAPYMESGLIQIARTEEVSHVTETPFGRKYTIDGTLLAPNESVVNVRTVWMIETGSQDPRLVTAHPLPRASKK